MATEIDAHSLAVLHKLGLSADLVRDHVLHPAHLDDATLHLELHEAGDVTDVVATPASGLFYRLDVDQLSLDLHNLLTPCVSGYALQLRRYGRTLIDRRWGWARTPADGAVAWTPGVQLHIASVSKLVTAMAMTKLLRSRAISPDARIARWLPAHWLRGPGVDQITFRQLLSHTSGLVALDEPGGADYQFMKDQIALGVVGGMGYRNLNYALCRILISTIDAPFLFDLFGPGVTDTYWDLTTTRYYQRYVQENVFDPVGATSTFVHTTEQALAYPFPALGQGVDSGDLSTMSGAVGWHLSVNDLLAVMAAFRRLGSIVDPTRAQAMLDRKFGIDETRDTLLGRIYAKGGFWSFDKGRRVEQTNAIFLPQGMELVIVANSPLCRPDTGFMGRVLDAIEANVKFRVLTTAAAITAGLAFAGLVGRTSTRFER
ncbi:MAG: serine hydrolase domain-containing protein [Acidobacteriota bacterium]